MIFPRFVFKTPGSISRAGGTYDQKLVEDEAEYDAAIEDGWSHTIVDALDRQVPVKDGAPTRAEIEAKAEELGLKIDKRKSDATLLAEIEEALKK